MLGGKNKRDTVLLGGVLTKEDLFQILRMDIETLSVKAKSRDGISKDDLRPLLKSISDLRGIGMGGNDSVQKAVDFQMKLACQLVIQQEVKAALENKNHEERKRVVNKGRDIHLRTTQFKELEKEYIAVEKETLKRMSEELQKLKAGSDQSQKNNVFTKPKEVVPAPMTKTSQIQYDVLVDSMGRVRNTLDSTEKDPGAILSAAGGKVDLVTGDLNTVHLWVGDWHGVVKTGLPSIPNQTTRVIGEVDSKTSEGKWEIRMHQPSPPNDTLMRELDHYKTKVRELEQELGRVRALVGEGGSIATIPPFPAIPKSHFQTTPQSPFQVLRKERNPVPQNIPTIEEQDSSSQQPETPEESLAPYLKMIHVGVPREVVELKMKVKGLDPALLDGDSSLRRLTIKIYEDERFIPFLKMLDMGVPKDAVKIKMKSKGFDPAILDLDPNDFSPVDGSVPQQSKTRGKKKDDGYQWKKLYWQPVLLSSGKSIWSRNSRFELQEVERYEIKHLFALKVGDPKNVPLPTKSKVEKVQVIDSARAQNVSIILKKFRLDAKDLRKMIITMQVSNDLFADDVKSILSLLPTQEEADKLNKVKQKDKLGDAELHFLGLLAIPRYKSRISCFLFKLQFKEIKADLAFDMTCCLEALTKLRESTNLDKLFSILLALGNNLNSMGGLLTEEDGFQAIKAIRLTQSLSKCKLVKAHGSPKTLLNVLVGVLHEREPQVLEYVLSETEPIRAASTVVLSNVKAQLKGLAMGVKELENEVQFGESLRANVELSKSLTREDELHFETLKGFYECAQSDIELLFHLMTQVDKSFAEALVYFKEDPETTPEGLFKALVSFFDELHISYNENTLARVKLARAKGA